MNLSESTEISKFNFPYNSFKVVQYPSVQSWAWTTAAHISSGLLIKYAAVPLIGDGQEYAVKKFLSTLINCQIGVIITAVITYLLQLTSFSITSEDNQILALITTIVGILKFRIPIFQSQKNSEIVAKYFSGSSLWNWVCICAVPSLLFCGFKRDVELWALQFTIIAGIAGTTAGTVLPLHRFKDVGLLMSSVGIGSILFGSLVLIINEDEIIIYPNLQPTDFGILMVFLGFLIEDTMALKAKAERKPYKNPQEFNSLSSSLPLHYDLIFVYLIFSRLIDTNQLSFE